MSKIAEKLRALDDRDMRFDLVLEECAEEDERRDAEIERLRDQTNAYRAAIEREVTAHVTTIQTLNQQDAEIERLRGLLREYLENDLTDEWEYDFLKRVREALGDE
jgi:hypothetical protein